MKNILTTTLLSFISLSLFGQTKQDTVIVNLANSSQVMFTMKDRNDLPKLREYDYQALFDDILDDLEDSIDAESAEPAYSSTMPATRDTMSSSEYKDPCGPCDDKKKRRTNGTLNFDFGMNNYLDNGNFPDDQNQLYTVRPWGSWYVAMNAMEHTHIDGPLYLDWGIGGSVYNFKFEKDNIHVTKNETGVLFSEDNRDVDFIKSKLAVSYLNVSILPMFNFGEQDSRNKFWTWHNSGFRIGAGVYGGYRIGSISKIVFDDGDREKEIDHDNFYLNNFRYGVRLQFGFGSTDFFFNYDLNELYNTDKPGNPDLNAFSFGVTF